MKIERPTLNQGLKNEDPPPLCSAQPLAIHFDESVRLSVRVMHIN